MNHKTNADNKTLDSSAKQTQSQTEDGLSTQQKSYYLRLYGQELNRSHIQKREIEPKYR